MAQKVKEVLEKAVLTNQCTIDIASFCNSVSRYQAIGPTGNDAIGERR